MYLYFYAKVKLVSTDYTADKSEVREISAEWYKAAALVYLYMWVP